jgi:hypothetical protein
MIVQNFGEKPLGNWSLRKATSRREGNTQWDLVEKGNG